MKRNYVRPIIIGYGVFALVASLIHTVYMAIYYDESVCHFQTGHAPVLLYVLCAVAMAVSAVLSAILVKKEDFEVTDRPHENRLSVFPAVFTGLMLILSPILELIKVKGGEYAAPSNTRLVMLTLSVAAGTYFVYQSQQKPVRRSAKTKNITTVLQCCTIAWVVFFLISEYFDMSTPLTSAIRIATQVALVFVMLYFVTETRLDIPEMFQSRRYVFFTCCALIMLLLCSVGETVLVFTGFRYANHNTIYNVAMLGMALYIFTRAYESAQE